MIYFVVPKGLNYSLRMFDTEQEAVAWTDARVPYLTQNGFNPHPYEVIAIDESACRYHHTASRRGYMSRKNPRGTIDFYRGKFGKGYVVLRPRWDTSNYIYVDYYILDD